MERRYRCTRFRYARRPATLTRKVSKPRKRHQHYQGNLGKREVLLAGPNTQSLMPVSRNSSSWLFPVIPTGAPTYPLADLIRTKFARKPTSTFYDRSRAISRSCFPGFLVPTESPSICSKVVAGFLATGDRKPLINDITRSDRRICSPPAVAGPRQRVAFSSSASHRTRTRSSAFRPGTY